jgi:hypothetical protein
MLRPVGATSPQGPVWVPEIVHRAATRSRSAMSSSTSSLTSGNAARNVSATSSAPLVLAAHRLDEGHGERNLTPPARQPRPGCLGSKAPRRNAAQPACWHHQSSSLPESSGDHTADPPRIRSRGQQPDPPPSPRQRGCRAAGPEPPELRLGRPSSVRGSVRRVPLGCPVVVPGGHLRGSIQCAPSRTNAAAITRARNAWLRAIARRTNLDPG